jgi:hypothetical protein
MQYNGIVNFYWRLKLRLIVSVNENLADALIVTICNNSLIVTNSDDYWEHRTH